MEAVARPGADQRHPPGPSVLTVGTVVWLASELMFFSGLFAAYFTLRAVARGPWPPEGVEFEVPLAALATLLLVASSATMQLGVRAFAAGDIQRYRSWVFATLALSAFFLANQGREWDSADFSVSSHTFGSLFYVMTGFHGLHVLGGMLAMVVLLGRSVKTRASGTGSGHAGRPLRSGHAGRPLRSGHAGQPVDLPAVEVVSYYWHFVDVVWIGLFAVIFLLQ